MVDMGDNETIIIEAFSQNSLKKNIGPVAFNRIELNAILRVYGQMVAAGEWRDYAIDHLDDRAVFSIFRGTAEIPLYRVEKNPKLANRQGAYSVIAASGFILKRGKELCNVLKIFDKKLFKIV